MEYKKITSLNQLKKLVLENGNKIECFIPQKEGLCDNKTIHYKPKSKWNIIHELSQVEIAYGSDAEFIENEPKLFDALKKGTLYKYNFSTNKNPL